MTFGEYLRELREARKLNKNKFAQALGIPFSTANAWELHGATPNKKSLTAIIEVLALAPTETKKLTDLWLLIPGRHGKRASETRPDQRGPAVPDPRAQKELESLLTAALVPGRHTISDGAAVLAALGEAALFIRETGITSADARRWLDAAARLREKGQRVTGALLAAAMVERPDHPPDAQENGPQKKDRTSH